MGYENVIQRFNRMHRKVDLDAILAMWAANTGPLNVYVHSPFCSSICKFCYYKGVEFSFDRDAELYERFYRSYLPEVVRPFQELLAHRTIGNYFFGGGTPSLMQPDTLREVFALFPGLRDVPSKTFEVHPAVWSEEQLDVLAEHGFNCCIIGIQSFDERVLARQNRLHANYETVARLARAIHARGMYLASDLIYRMDSIDADSIFERDLEHVATLGCDVVSLQLNYDDLANDQYNERFFELILDSGLDANYYWEGRAPLSINQKKTMKCFRYVRNEIPAHVYANDIFSFIRTLDEASKLVDRGELPSVIGFGSYRNPRKNTFSNVRDGTSIVEYIEVNNGWKPEYFITYESQSRDFFEECGKRLELLKSIGPPPHGVKIWFENTAARGRDDKIIRSVTSQVGLGVTWDYMSPRTQAYIDKLKQLFPDWDWWED